MDTPFMDLHKRLIKIGCECSYGDVLLVAEFLFGVQLEGWRDRKMTPHHKAAAARLQDDGLEIKLIELTVDEEIRRRWGGDDAGCGTDESRRSSTGVEVVPAKPP